MAVQMSKDSKKFDFEAIAEKKMDIGNSERTLWFVSALACIFIALEVIGGILSSSLSICADAAHMLSDVVSFVVGIVSIRIAKRPPSASYPFGLHRSEVLGAAASILLLWILTAVLVAMAVQDILGDKIEVNADTMLITASFGVVFNVIMGWVLQRSAQGGLSHHGVHSSGSVNIRAAFAHVLGDLLQSIGVFLAALLIKFTSFTLADPLCTLLFSITVLGTSMPVMRDIARILMQAAPQAETERIEQTLLSLPSIQSVHSLRLWQLNAERTICTVHLSINDYSNAVKAVEEAVAVVTSKHGVSECTIQVERARTDHPIAVSTTDNDYINSISNVPK